MPDGVVAQEVRLLEGPNLYFTKPALTVEVVMTGPMAAAAAQARTLGAAVGLRARAGAAGSVQRRAFLMRVVEKVVRRVAQRAGISRVGVRVRAGNTPDLIVVAVVWRHRGRAIALGEGLAPLLEALASGGDSTALIDELADAMGAATGGSGPAVLTPQIPVVSITGTNGKTTTTRLLAHISMTAGYRTAWSSTDGVVAHGVVVEAGDYSGPAGARGVLATPGVQIGVLETARGGLLLKGMGVTSNDVSVVTNVSADHLGMRGIDTLDQLAEVKAIVTTVTKPAGWAVLNGEDPRVWAMRSRTKARPWAFALDPSTPALRDAIGAGGRGITIEDGNVVVLAPGGVTERLLPVLDIPATLAGLSEHNVANALAAAAAALALGLPKEAVVEGLRTFQPDDRLNPGRMNIYSVAVAGGSVSIILDLAHNEAGLDALMDVARGLCQPGSRVLLVLGTAGDRSDEIIAALGEIAGKRADQVVIGHKHKYLRDRSVEDFELHFGIGLARAGIGEVPAFPSELDAVAHLLAAATDGDVIAAMIHEQREEIVAWLLTLGARPDDASVIRAKVAAAQGRHDLDEEFATLWALPDDERCTVAESLHARFPDDARVTFEYAGALDAAGREGSAIPAYELALAQGLREPHRHRARIQLASSLRNVGRYDLARTLLEQLRQDRPESAAVAAFGALVDLSDGAPGAAVADLIDALLTRATDDDSRLYRAALARYAARLREQPTGYERAGTAGGEYRHSADRAPSGL